RCAACDGLPAGRGGSRIPPPSPSLPFLSRFKEPPMQRLTILSASCLLAGSALAQDGVTAPNAVTSLAPVQINGIGTDPVPGKIAGTFRYNVTFRNRGFDLGEFKAAIDNRQPANVVH